MVALPSGIATALTEELNIAIRSGRLKDVQQVLFKAGKETFLNTRANGNLPLEVAITEAKDNKLPIISLLVKNGARPQLIADQNALLFEHDLRDPIRAALDNAGHGHGRN